MTYRRTVVCVALAASTLLAASASAGQSSQAPFLVADRSQPKVVDRQPEVLPFVAVPPALEAGSHRMSAVFAQGAVELYRETVAFQLPADPPKAAIELLAMASDETRSDLLGRTERLAGPVRVAVTFDDLTTTEFVLADILEGAPRLLAAGHEPVDLTAEAPLFQDGGELSRATAASCVDDCNDEFDYCVYNQCDYQWDPCEHCYQQAEECSFQCQCPTYTEWEEWDRVFVSYTGYRFCAQDWRMPQGYRSLYDEVWVRDRFTTYRKTTNCDHSTTTTVVSVTYGSTTYICHQYLNYPCSGGSPYTPVCIVQ